MSVSASIFDCDLCPNFIYIYSLYNIFCHSIRKCSRLIDIENEIHNRDGCCTNDNQSKPNQTSLLSGHYHSLIDQSQGVYFFFRGFYMEQCLRSWLILDKFNIIKTFLRSDDHMFEVMIRLQLN